LPRGLNFTLNGTSGECLPKGNPKIYRFKTFFSREKSRVAPSAQPQAWIMKIEMDKKIALEFGHVKMMRKHSMKRNSYLTREGKKNIERGK